MYNLIVKDVLIQKKYILLSIVYTVFFGFIFGQQGSSMIFGAIPIMISYILLIGACGSDDKNNCEIMLNSLPVKRSSIVISKYLSIFVFVIMSLALAFAVEVLFNSLGVIHLTKLVRLEDILGAFVGSVLFGCIYLPIYFKLGYQKARYFFIFVFFAFFAGPYTIAQVVKKGSGTPNFILYLNSKPDWLVGASIIGIICMVWIISLVLSIKFYAHRDL